MSQFTTHNCIKYRKTSYTLDISHTNIHIKLKRKVSSSHWLFQNAKNWLDGLQVCETQNKQVNGAGLSRYAVLSLAKTHTRESVVYLQLG
ncbi:hypothetical protein C0J52_00669 [Blattella germanica]|nr:hypothetical protein C0J52_00669 [Blattella germanica]